MNDKMPARRPSRRAFFAGLALAAAAACTRASEARLGEAGARFPLTLRRSERFLRDASGRPFLMNGDSAWSLIANLTREDAVAYLDDRKARGFNAIIVSLIEHRFSQHAPNNFYDVAPFTTPGDFSTPNEAYFAHADYVLAQAAERDILVLLAPAYLGVNGGDEGWYEDMRSNGRAKLRQYGAFVGARYAHLNNIIWMHGGDYNAPDKALVRVIMHEIKAANPNALHTAHCERDTAAHDWYEGESWLDLNNVYTRDDMVGSCLRQYSAAQMPFVMIESAYEPDHNSTPQSIRAQAYQPLLSGACGQFFGNSPIWRFGVAEPPDDPLGWRESLDSVGARSMSVLFNLFAGLNWHLLTPDRDERLLTAGHGEGAAAAQATDGSFAMIYLPNPRAISVDLSSFARRRVRARWFDPSSGVFTELPESSAATIEIAPHGEGDAVLLLESL